MQFTFKTKEVNMPKSQSGRVVIELPEELKKQLYAKLALSGESLKTWFVRQVQELVNTPKKQSREKK